MIPHLLLIATACASLDFEFKAPQQTEEERFSGRLPASHKCDGCKAIAFQIYDAVDRHKHLFSKRVLEVDALDIIDTACDVNIYRPYGIVQLDGKNKLNGPGIVSDKIREGIMQMNGGLWPKRLSVRCLEITGTRGELELVQSAVKATPFEFWRNVCATDCKMSEIRKQEL